MKQLIFLILITVSFQLFAVKENTYDQIQQVTNSPFSTINEIVQDETGFLWVASWKGLYRYDGNSLLSFRQLNDKFLALKINDLKVAKNFLWVSTNHNGIYKINLEDYSYENWSETNGNFITDYSLSITIDAHNNFVWVGTQNYGLVRINPKNNQQKVFDNRSEKDFSTNTVTSVLCSSEKFTLIGTRNGVLMKTDSTQHFQRILEKEITDYVLSIYQDPIGQIWVGDRKGTYKLTRVKNRIEVIKLFDYSTFQFSLSKDAKTLNLSTENGLKQVDIYTQNIASFAVNGEKLSMPVTCSFETNENAIWVGARRKGLFLLSKTTPLITQKENPLNDFNVAVSHLISLGGDRIFFHEWLKGVFYGDSEKIISLKNEILDNASLNALYLDKFNNIWFSIRGKKGVYRFNIEHIDLTNGTIDTIEYIPNLIKKKRYQLITAISGDDKGNVLFGTYTGDIFKYRSLQKTFDTLTFKGGSFCRNKAIHSILVDKNEIWVATGGAGIFKAVNSSGNEISDLKNYTVKEGISSNFSVNLYKSENNILWIGADDGLSAFDGEKFHQFFKNDHSFYSIESIIEDKKGFLWLGTSQGLIRINTSIEDKNYQIFTSNDGLKNHDYFDRAVTKDAQGNLYFGGTQGIDVFLPEKIVTKQNITVPTITAVYLGGEKVAYHHNEFISGRLSDHANIELPYDKNSLAFDFSNLALEHSENVLYAYRLLEHNEHWSVLPKGVNYLEFNELPSGSYTIQIKSTNVEGVWSSKYLQLNVMIDVPFWRHPMAFVIYILVTILGIYFFTHRKLIKAHHLHQLQLDQLELQQQSQLDELKMKLYVNISHEFKTPLTLILGPLANIIRQKKENDPFFEQHILMYNNADRLLKLVNRVINLGKSDQTEIDINVEKANFNAFIQQIQNAFIYEAQRRNIGFEVDNNIGDFECFYDKEIVEDIIFNLLSNAFKYTPSGKKVAVEIDKTGDLISIKVMDQGKGIQEDVIDKIFERYYGDKGRSYSTGIGLNYSKRLAQLHKGDLLVQNNLEGEGATFTLLIPALDIYQESEKAIKDYSSRDTISIYEEEKLISLIEDIKVNNDEMDAQENIALVVDDNPDIRTFIKSVLSPEFTVIEANNGEEGFEKAIETIPNIIISDVMMPEMDGFTFCDKIKKDERTDHIPVILTTVLSENEDRLKGLKVGADSYIPKPINPEHLLVRVEKLLSTRKKLIEKYAQYVEVPKGADQDEDTVTATPEVVEHPLLKKSREIILENVTNEDYDVDAFASDLGFSRTQLYRKFKGVSNLSVNKFIRKIKMEKAAELLIEGELNIKQVTYEVGFNDLKYFRKCFQEQFGVTPSTYIKEQRGEAPFN
ncbi:hybrid sensor histidine kinase/response regulator transcription factor [Flammeovirga agarivorans]|uniref:histidine kinase n=1 Tax=Flammeovirga agarivorans TaxID=2726742 RepID=A0A7X8SK44_9BACT|nr:hybrid sensor histidine kinase/response regulator transcription factor [Flammeovirga agarivorans]NLR91708.1 response regulator [Flammeovirga agarivorans]